MPSRLRCVREAINRTVRPTILVLADWYLPGYKAGGLVTSLANVVESLKNSFEFFVITRDRDLTDAQPYAGVQANEWVSTGGARALYTADFSFSHLRRRFQEVAPDIVYLNSFFSTVTIKILALRRMGLLPGCAMVLAPRGEFSPGALKLKRWRKWLYRNFALRGGFYSNLVWHASSGLEREHIKAILHKTKLKQPSIHEAWELPNSKWLRLSENSAKPAKRIGEVRFLSLSRVSKMKNLIFALDLLGNLKGRVEFDIYGPLDDRGYWSECKKRIESLPGNVVMNYRGAISRETVPRIAGGYHFFLLPTLGENFGYAILEAMAAGCPVVISDLTPWHDAEPQGAGWCLPLADRALWRRTLQQCVDMDQQTYATFSLRAREFVEAYAASNNHLDQTFQLFNLALNRSVPPSASSSLGVPAGPRE